MIAGVCAGLANRWGVSAVAVRVMFVLLSLLAGVGVLAYGLLWMLLPHTDGRIHAQELLGGRLTAGFVGALLAIIAGSGLDGFDDNGPGFFPLVLIALVVAFVIHRSRRSATR
jgi:phage shock protein PspC (stress-responsive transcriptional regulator)